MTYAAHRLAELCAKREPLTEAEQREAVLRAKQDRRNKVRKARYHSDPEYRQRVKAGVIASRRRASAR